MVYEVDDVALSKQRRQVIIDSLISEIGNFMKADKFSVNAFAKSHGLSVQSVYRYLERLEDDSIIARYKEGKANVYSLVDSVYQYKYNLNNLAEDVVWNGEIRPLLQDFPETAVNNCNYAFCEMLNNAIDHSEGCEVVTSIHINAFRASFLIVDDGVGIFTKIASALYLEEKRFAILELEKGKFTTAPDSHTGEGIFFSAKASDVFVVFSDDLAFSSLSLGEGEIEQLSEAKSAHTGGTAIYFEVFRNHSTTTAELFDRYTQEPDHYGFTKTVVPVKLLEYGNSNPSFISRSQAKRLLARFERFERIELDFTGITEIGQGFADEVFRVFQKQYPNCRITAKNYNQNVRKMISHVIGASICEYALYDIDGNGVDELLVRHPVLGDEETKIYTYVNGSAHEIGKFWSRSSLVSIDEQGNLYRKWSQGAAHSGCDILRLSDDRLSLVVVERWAYDDGAATYSAKEESKRISEHESDIVFSRFYTMSGGVLEIMPWQTVTQPQLIQVIQNYTDGKQTLLL